MTEFGDHTNNALWEGSYLSLSRNGFKNISIIIKAGYGNNNLLKVKVVFILLYGFH